MFSRKPESGRSNLGFIPIGDCREHDALPWRQGFHRPLRRHKIAERPLYGRTQVIIARTEINAERRESVSSVSESNTPPISASRRLVSR